MPATVAISADFFTAFAALPRQVQNKVTDFICKFKNNPFAPGINYEKINDAADGKICSVRIDDTYRGIVVRQKETGVYLLLWVDHHDEAYEWARSKKCSVNQVTGNIQVYDVQYEEEQRPLHEDKIYGPFSKYSDSDLLLIGVPEEQLRFVKTIKHLSDFYDSKRALPIDAYEHLEWLVNDIPIQEVIELVIEEQESHEPDDLNGALNNAGTRQAFMVIEGEKELQEMLSAPLEKWRVFLHPSQRKIVESEYSGPARVLGGAGTGKTVVAMHRAKRLASVADSGSKIMFTTFTANLADDIRQNLKAICTPNEFRHIEVINLDAWVSRFLRENGFGATIVYEDDLKGLWEEAISRADCPEEYPLAFYQDEWSKVVASQDAFSKELYLKASRIGRGTRLDRKKRAQVWNVFEQYMILLKSMQKRDIDTALYECRKIVESRHQTPIFDSIIVDEGQDFSSNAYKLLRVLAGPQHRNDLFIVGDSHQRIYKNRAVLSQCGVFVRGRSSYLRINYRTTEEIRSFAFSILKGISFDDMDDSTEFERKCQSLTHGERPSVIAYPTLSDEAAAITDGINKLIKDGVDPKSICLVARTHKLLNDYSTRLAQSGLRVFEIKRSKQDDPNFDGVRIATMHRVKGLEFAYMFIAGMNRNIMPLASAINHTDMPSEQESIKAEKCLLYVALTRARQKVFVSCSGQPSELFS